MKAIKTIVTLKNINNEFVDQQLMEFYTFKEPSKDFIKDKIEDKLGGLLIEKDCSPEEGGDYGLFFFRDDMYITYFFKEIIIE